MIWKNPEYEYQLFSYALRTGDWLIYTYSYQQEENWSTYIVEDSIIEWSQRTYDFKAPCCFRLCVRKCNGKPLEAVPSWRELFDFEPGISEEHIWQEYFQEESRKTVETVRKLKTTDSFSMMLLTDSHYVNYGTWEDTAYNLKKTAEQVYPDMVVHLGDLTDGMLPEKVTKEYSSRIMRELNAIGVPVYICLGNHDSNYFKNNLEEMTEKECSEWYLNREKPYYYVDVPERKLRMLFLFSFDQHEVIRYGFPKEEIEWVRKILEELTEGWQVLVFSHVPPLPEIHFWSDKIRNGEEMMKVLEEYHNAHNGAVLAYIHGHNHAEQIYTERAFPIISIGCNKLEDFKDKKPEGSYTCDRKRDTVTHDLWDILVLNQEERWILYALVLEKIEV